MESTIGANTVTMCDAVYCGGCQYQFLAVGCRFWGGVVIDLMIVYAIEITAVVAGLMAVFI